MLYSEPHSLYIFALFRMVIVNFSVVFVMFCKPVKLLVLSSGQQLSLAPCHHCEIILSCSERLCLLCDLSLIPSLSNHLRRLWLKFSFPPPERGKGSTLIRRVCATGVLNLPHCSGVEKPKKVYPVLEPRTPIKYPVLKLLYCIVLYCIVLYCIVLYYLLYLFRLAPSLRLAPLLG